MPDNNKAFVWKALPKPCQKCFGVKRKRTRTENVASSLQCDFSSEPLSKVKMVDMNTKNTDGKDCSSDSTSARSLLTPTDDMLHSAVCSSGTNINNDAAVCSSLKATNMPAVTASTALSHRNIYQNFQCSSADVKQCTSGLQLRAPETGIVRPLFRNSEFKFGSQSEEADNPSCAESDVKVKAAANLNKNSDLHRCPLCDVIFDVRYAVLLIY